MIHSKSTDDLIAELNLLDESDAIEAKEVSGNEVGSSIYETICAFSNEPGLGGGVILLGLKKELGQLFPVYKLTGIKDPDKIQSDIVSACQSKFNTPIRPIVKRELIQNRTIVRIDIAELPAEQKPISIKNLGLPRGVLRRIGSSDVHCSQDDLIAFFQDRSHSNYDAHTVRDSSTQDIDPTAIALYRRFIAEHKPTSLVLSMTNDEILYSTTSLKTAE